MKKAKIYITGQIGNTWSEDGTVLVKGVELQDVVAQVEDAKNADATIEGFDVFINSLGGSVRIGKLIAKYIKSLPNCTTIAYAECASMGTEIHLAVPLAQRKIVEGTLYSIHNPLMANVSGNASELVEMAEMIKENEKDMAKMYVNATGLSKDAVTGLMNQETSLTPEQCKTMGFVSEIIPAPRLNAVAFFEPQIKTSDIMKTVKQLIDSAFATFKKDLNIAEVIDVAPVAMTGVDYTTSKGILNIALTGESPVIGDVATLDGVQAPAGEYVAEDGTKIYVDEMGLVSGIESPETEMSEMAILTAENETLKATIETMNADFEATLATAITELKAQIGSSFVPQQGQAKFSKTKQVEKSTAELALERKASYSKAKI